MATESLMQDFVVYDWINEGFFVKVLKQHESAEVEIKKFDVKPATAKGENFSSALFRVTLEYCVKGSSDVKKISIILKANLDTGYMNYLQTQFNIITKEATVYKHILNGMHDLMNKFGDGTVFSPSLIYDDNQALILEDLAVKGYKIVGRKCGLDLNHSRAVISKLAKFHASSAVFSKKDIDAFKFHLKGPADTDNPMLLLYQNCVKECVRLAKNHEELNQYVDFLTNFVEKLFENVKTLFTRIDGEFNVFNHGDLGTNNILWIEDADGNIDALLFIDHQENYFGSPSIDLNRFLYASCNKDVVINHMDELVQLYCDVLRSTLQQLKYDDEIPTLEDIKRGMRQKHDIAVIVMATMGIGAMENPEYASDENFISDSEEAKRIRKEVFDNPKYLDILKYLLPKVVSMKGEL